MSAKPRVYVAGVGLSPSSSSGSTAALVSAATKALLDAGITYDSIAKTISSKDLKVGRQVFDSFGDDGVPVDQVSSGSDLRSAFESIQRRGDGCVLVVAADKSAAIGVVLTSEDFMMRWPYLKDSSVLLSESGDDTGKSPSDTSLSDLCQKVWQLRGWKRSQSSVAEVSSHGYRLSRADGQKVPQWKDVEHKQDGKHRLGYNPATETRDVSQEDFEAVRAGGNTYRQHGNALFQKGGGDRETLKRQQRYMAKL